MKGYSMTYFPRKHPMDKRWPWWRLVWHWMKGHELTHWDRRLYPPPVCRDCEMDRLNRGEICRYCGEDTYPFEEHACKGMR